MNNNPPPPQEFYSTFTVENSGDQKKLLGVSKRLLNRQVNIVFHLFWIVPHLLVKWAGTLCRRLSTSRYGCIVPVTESFVSLFHCVISLSCQRFTVSFSECKKLSELNAKSLISNSSLKFCPLEPILSTLVSMCYVLLPVITRIINFGSYVMV